ncbi:recombinase family protein [uncultured Parolsenella sp.]|uniref:recombinase family protein n=1 Tax=uncultured Parolsenella sp. TaxID=2083008 RepID=UPI00344E85DB
MTKGRRAAIYARYSTHSQRSESIEIRLDASRVYCAENGLRVVAEYCDYAQTGTTADRAELQRMMADARPWATRATARGWRSHSWPPSPSGEGSARRAR